MSYSRRIPSGVFQQCSTARCEALLCAAVVSTRRRKNCCTRRSSSWFVPPPHRPLAAGPHGVCDDCAATHMLALTVYSHTVGFMFHSARVVIFPSSSRTNAHISCPRRGVRKSARSADPPPLLRPFPPSTSRAAPHRNEAFPVHCALLCDTQECNLLNWGASLYPRVVSLGRLRWTSLSL